MIEQTRLPILLDIPSALVNNASTHHHSRYYLDRIYSLFLPAYLVFLVTVYLFSGSTGFRITIQVKNSAHVADLFQVGLANLQCRIQMMTVVNRYE